MFSVVYVKDSKSEELLVSRHDDIKGAIEAALKLTDQFGIKATAMSEAAGKVVIYDGDSRLISIKVIRGGLVAPSMH